MVNLKILIIEEVIKRIKRGITNNSVLNSIKSVKIGAFSEARDSENLPVVNIFLKTVKENASTFKGRSSNQIELLIRLICNKNINQDNTLFTKNNSNYSGPLIILDQLLNEIEKDENNDLDLSLGNKTFQNEGYDYEIIEENDIIIFDISFFITSNEFTNGQR